MSRVPVRASSGPVICIILVLSLLISPVTTEDAEGAPGTVTRFSSGASSYDIEFDQVFGEDNVGLALKLPKQSNALGVSVDLNGSVHEGSTLTQTISTADDWAKGNQQPDGHLIFDDEGFKLDMANVTLFENEKEITAGQNVSGVSSGDFNGDGRDDIVVCNRDSDTATVYLQRANGKLTKDRDVNTDDEPNVVEASDINGDGRDDFAVGTLSGQSINVFLSRSTGGFNKTTVSPNRQVLDLDIADLNDDGKDDIVIAAYMTYGMIYFQNSIGGFDLHRSMIVTSGGYYYYTYNVRGCAAGDFNNDGRMDVAFTVSTAYTSTWSYRSYGMLKIHLQSSSGTFSSSHTYRYYAYNYALGIDAGDVTGDGRDDIVITNHYTNQVRLFIQRTSYGFLDRGVIATFDRPTWPVIGDVDGDGLKDALVGGANETMGILFQGGTIIGSISWTIETKNPIQNIALGDLNNDGRTDAATANMEGDSVSIWLQRSLFSANWTSHRIDTPVPLKEITFKALIVDDGGNTSFKYSFDKTNWTDMVNDIPVSTPLRPDTLWLRLSTSTTDIKNIDVVKQLVMDMTFSGYPAGVTFDVGADGSVDWETKEEVISRISADGFEDAISDYVLDPDNLPDTGGWVTVPITVHSTTPGYLHVSGLRLMYNNASKTPTVLGPANDTFVNATPTFRFSALDDNGDDLKYMIQITTTNFSDVYNTHEFDMRESLYDVNTGEGFARPFFREGTDAQFTLPAIYGLEMNTTYRWRVLAYDGHLVSDPSLPITITVDSRPPSGFAVSPRYSDTLSFKVSWSAEDPSPGAGLALEATYDVQFRTLEGQAWTDWLMGTKVLSSNFNGREGVTYLFRMRARDAVGNVNVYSVNGDTTTTVDTLGPEIEVIHPAPWSAATEGKQELRIDASDDTCYLVQGDVVFSLDGGPWTDMMRLYASSTEWRRSIDTSSLQDGEHQLKFRATDAAGQATEVAVTMVVDNNDPTCEAVSPRSGDMVTGIHLFRIKAEDALGIKQVNLQLYGLPGISDRTARYSASSDAWELAIAVTSLPEGQASYTAQSIDTSGRSSPLVGPIHFSVDNQGPNIELIHPTPETYITTETVTIRASVTDLHFNPTTEEVLVRIANGEWTSMTLTSSEFLYNWRLSGIADGEHTLEIKATDRASLVTIFKTLIKVDRSPPLMSIISPEADGAVSGLFTLEVDVVDSFLDRVQFSLDLVHWMEVVDGTATFDSTQYSDGVTILTVTALDLAGGETVSSISIMVDNIPPDIVPTRFPDMGQSVGGVVPFELTVEEKGGMGTVRTDVGGVIDTLTAIPSTGVYTFTLDTSGITDGPLDVMFIATDRAGNEDLLTWTVRVDNTPPEIDVIAPGRDADGTIEFTVDITDASTVTEVQLKIGDRPWVFMYRASDGTYRHQWDTGSLDNGKDLDLQVRASDEVGNTAEQVQKLDVTNPPFFYVGVAILMALILLGVFILYRRRGVDEGAHSTEKDKEVIATSDDVAPVPEDKGPGIEPLVTEGLDAQDEWVESVDD